LFFGDFYALDGSGREAEVAKKIQDPGKRRNHSYEPEIFRVEQAGRTIREPRRNENVVPWARILARPPRIVRCLNPAMVVETFTVVLSTVERLKIP
jgi:hypothetical protein